MAKRTHQIKLRGNPVALEVYDEISRRMPGLSQAEIVTAALLTFEALLLSDSDQIVRFHRTSKSYIIGEGTHREGVVPIYRSKKSEEPDGDILPPFQPPPPVIIPTQQGSPPGAPKENPLAALKKRASFTPIE